ncbi:MAG: ADP-glyceromanno-heptose 6-epimerase [Deltaproteobacteria bacterium]|nr:ADP-glyceromanno-heptose 6-epimerase [Deltaproteobacteria bacterium]
MLVVTGGAGFIGSNLARALAERAGASVVVVDNLTGDLTQGPKFRNLVGVRLADYLDKDDFLDLVTRRDALLERVEHVFHLGACSDTTAADGSYLMRNNFEYSKRVARFCLEGRVPLVYASSAAVYGAGRVFREAPEHERPLNVYGYSKQLFDDWVRQRLPGARSPLVGLRFFNVYGPREAHKGAMASMAYQLHEQLRATGVAPLFAGTDGYADGEQVRDFVYVDDVVAVGLWFLEHPARGGIYNVGTGRARSFNDLAAALIGRLGRGRISYVPFPEALAGVYQSCTRADLSALRGAGYDGAFRSLEEGVAAYVAWLAGGSDGR